MFMFFLGYIACYLSFMLCYVIICDVIFMVRYITCYVVMLYNMFSYAMLYKMLCSVVYLTL